MTASTPLAAPAGRRRFWLTVAAFALANLAIWVGYHQFHASRKPHLLRVEKFSHADGGTVAARPKLTWTFNLDVAKLPDNQPAGAITPAVPGTWSWPTPRTLAFTPDSDLPKATRFTIALPQDKLRTVEGFQLDKPFSSSFQTAPLTLRNARQAGFDGDRLILELEFDDAVVPADVISHLQVFGADGKSLACEPHGDTPGQIVRVRTAPLPPAKSGEAETAVRVALSAGLAGRSGPLAMTAPAERAVPFAAELIATEATAYSSGPGESQIRVEFNNAVEIANIRQILSIEPDVPFTISSSYNGLELDGDFTPGSRYAVKLAAPRPGSDRAQFPRPATLSVFVPDHAPSVWFEHDSGYLGSKGNRTLLAHAVNTFDLTVRVTRLYDNNLVEWRNASARDAWRGPDAYAAPIVEKTIHLPKKKNEKQEIKLSLDDLLPKDAPRDGAYRVSVAPIAAPNAGDDEIDYRYRGGDAASVVTLSDIGLSAKCGRNEAVIWATSLSTAAPLPGVRVRAFSSKNQPIGEALTSPDGLARIPLAKPIEGEEVAVLVADRSDAASEKTARDLTWLDLREGKVNFGEADTGGRRFLREGHEAFVYTDRGVYRPGETVHLRTLVRGPDHATPKPFPISFQIVRPDLRNWRSQSATLDADGSAGFELALPKDLPTGKWTAKVSLPGVSGATKTGGAALGSVTFQVEEFMPDRMKVDLSLGGASDDSTASVSRRLSLGDAPVHVEAQADYLFGRPVAARPAKVVARIDPAEFRPAGWAGWTFADAGDTASVLGLGKPLGRRSELPEMVLDAKGHAAWDIDVRALISTGDPVDKQSNDSAKPADGNADYAGPWTLTTTSSVSEEGGRAVSATRRVDIDLVPHYVGIQRPRQLIRPKQPCEFGLALVSPDGKIAPQEGELTATLYRESWNNSLVRDDGHYRYESTRVLDPVGEVEGTTVPLASGRGVFKTSIETGGAYVLHVRDETTGGVSSISFYAGNNAWDDQISRENPEALELVVLPPGGADAFTEALRQCDVSSILQFARTILAPAPEKTEDRTFRIGERPRVLVRSPFKGRLLLTVETDGIVQSHVVDMKASQVTVPIDITPACLPNAYVTATVVRPIDPDAAWRAHRASGATRLRVDNTAHRLNVEIAAPTEIRPSSTLDAGVRVTDSDGNAVANAAVTVAAVDEGICRLTDFKTPDPLGFFTADRALSVKTADLYGRLMPEVPKPGKTSTPGGDSSDDRHRSPVAAKRVKPVALFTGVVHTDAQGVARVPFAVPPFAGELRLMAVAYANIPTKSSELPENPAMEALKTFQRSHERWNVFDARITAATEVSTSVSKGISRGGFGSAEQRVTVRSPILVQSSWPRFAAPGDRFNVPLVVFNSTATGGEVELRLELPAGPDGKPGPLKFASGEESVLTRKVQIASSGQATASVELVALNRVGVAPIRLVATLGNESFEETLELPVRPASPTLTRGGYAAAEQNAPAKLDIPPDILPGTERLQVNATPWPDLQLPEGLDYLDRYPYGCAEQTLSGLLPLVYLDDIGEKIAPNLFERDRVVEKVNAGVIHLLGLRTADGGLGMWPGARQSWPWASVYAAHFAVEARAAGHAIPDDLYDGLLGYARTTLNKSGDAADALEAQAYACYVLALAGKPERAAMSRLGEVLQPKTSASSESTLLPTHARFHLAAAWLAAGRKDLANDLIPATLPQPRATRAMAGNVGSPMRDRALLLSTLLAVQPNRPDLPALAQSLADAGRNGKWQSTQDTAFAVMALGRYVKQAKQTEPYTGLSLWNGSENCLTQINGNTPLAWKTETSALAKQLELRLTGPAGAKAHVSWLQTGVPLTPPKDADHGMKIRRRYLDDKGQPLQGNALRSGDLVKVELTIEAPAAFENVVIEDLLPAGLEIENPRLLTQDAQQNDEATPDDAPPTFADRRLDIRDDRLILAGDLPAAGVLRYVYTARAVAPGTFVLPPVRAECMYDIGTSSISGGGQTLRVLLNGGAPIADVGGE